MNQVVTLSVGKSFRYARKKGVLFLMESWVLSSIEVNRDSIEPIILGSAFLFQFFH